MERLDLKLDLTGPRALSAPQYEFFNSDAEIVGLRSGYRGG